MCNQPLKGFKYGKTDKGKDNYIIRKGDVDHLEILDDGRIINVYDPHRSASNRVIREYIEIPCGKCLQCKLDYSRRWADRCMLESQYHDKNAFITLTYDDKFIPHDEGVDPVTGQIREFNSLRKSDVQNFFKSLRNLLNEIPKEKRCGKYAKRRYYHDGDSEFTAIRFMACGEYGPKTSRPHYHAIIFGWSPPDDDIVPIGKNDLNQIYYGSETLAKAWNKGFHMVSEFTYETAAYVSRYVTKKMFPLQKEFYEKCNIEPEFLLMSRRPGIGSAWYDDHKECYSTNLNQYVKTKNGSHKIGSVKFFDNKLVLGDPEKYEEIKLKRIRFAKLSKALVRKQTTLPYLDYLKIREDALERRTKILKGGTL